jgi:hypothetical protein
VRAWLARAPWWGHALISGTLFAAFMALYSRFGQDRNWTASLVGGLLGGVIFGVVMGLWAARYRGGLREAAGEEEYGELARLPLFRRKRALAVRPDLREATARALLHQRTQLLRQRRWAVPATLFFIALELWAALTRSPWFWSAVALFVAALANYFVMPGVIDRKVRSLREHGVGS